ncbi:MAG: FHA domain-containing protein [Leptolyngbyaceae cyanobacterium RU_5_1]|nr:FHA domain-containing protein [Leptolyngbyaceae cyanobacterium RU_5_1]
MIVCPNCNHQNPDGALQCEACYTPLPEITTCPNCGATVQTDASFCGQCGFSLRSAAAAENSVSSSENTPSFPSSSNIPDLVPPDPLVVPEPVTPSSSAVSSEISTPPEPISATVAPNSVLPTPEQPASPFVETVSTPPSASVESRTQLQQQTARLFHVQTNTSIELPPSLTVVHIGKPNDRIPPDIDVSGFPNSEIVSRIHADVRLEGDAYYIEDVGSSNGTYINNLPLAMGNRHRLRPGDRIALGKGDKVTFLFQLS